MAHRMRQELRRLEASQVDPGTERQFTPNPSNGAAKLCPITHIMYSANRHATYSASFVRSTERLSF
jgi:hypothetical protein